MKSFLSALAIFLMMLIGSYALLIGFADQAGITQLEKNVYKAKQAMEVYRD